MTPPASRRRAIRGPAPRPRGDIPDPKALP